MEGLKMVREGGGGCLSVVSEVSITGDGMGCDGGRVGWKEEEVEGKAAMKGSRGEETTVGVRGEQIYKGKKKKTTP